MAEEEQAGRGTVPAERVRDSGSAAEEWAEVEAGRDQAPEAEARGLEARAEAEGRVRAEGCGRAEPAEARAVVRAADQVLVEDRARAEAELAVALGLEAEVAVPGEVGEQVADRAGAEAQVQVRV